MVWTYLIPATPVFELIQQTLLYPPNTLQLFKREQKLIQNPDSSSKSAKRIAIQCDQNLITVGVAIDNFYKQDNSNFVFFLWMNSYGVTIQIKANEQYLHMVKGQRLL